ncbi:MFS transporter [Neobacillus cucumis]|uniref:MFS transporter n=1 Tax=Neobacillus cucumis TaxID=1740721 RepID=UPI00203D415A|nr:MFS transporter [Neobacillus cucumis]MCM3726313.1 MFS transporter [Neobacillus cucumis]
MRWITLGFLFVLFTINYADKSIAGFASVHISKEFGLSPIQWGLVGSSFFWSFIISSIFGSSLSERFGTKKMLTFMALIWSILQLGAFFIHNLEALIIYRILLGVFEGPFFAIVLTHLYKWFAPESRGAATAIINFGSPVGSLVSAPILVYFINHFGWRMAFASLGILSLVWLVLWVFIGKEHPENSVVEEKIKKGTVPVKPKVRFSEVSSALASRNFILTILLAFTAYWLLTWIQVWMPSYLIKVVKVSSTEMGNLLAITGLGAGLFTIGIATISRYIHKKTSSYKMSHVVVIGVSILIGACLFYSITQVHSVAWVIFCFCAGKGLYSIVMSLGPHMISRLVPERSTFMIGTYTACTTLAGVIGPIVTGSLVQKAGNNVVQGYNSSILLFAVLGGVFAILYILIANPDKFFRKKELSVEKEPENLIV